ncbi:6-hydroxymethylpterin diphosphokinase MptE-like protein [Treponema pectinovorum]|uniref:6-hydroxymethylpterin diphosphokinase MptE-like protein n=1 Tax=Treponema pectinovorum TaxID=164 RepID=UPI001658E5C0|nr:6-hydroxymethylpterin diphosphokinase MptE-like protein [Treponema pectinovorum]
MTTSKNAINFALAKNGEKTCTLNGIYFHSSYSPSKEAQKFVESVNFNFIPSCILIIEPGLSYCEQFLRNKFPNAKLYAIRIFKDFYKADNLWDEVFYFFETENFAQKLYSALSEEALLSAGILNLPSCNSAIPDLTQRVWSEIKKAILISNNVLLTRSFFSKKWFLNSLNFFSLLKKVYIPKKFSKDIIVTASGPSLESSLKNIKSFRCEFFILALSSSLPVLLKREIIPDMVLSTDGGFWAKKHLEFNSKTQKLLQSTIFAFCDESAFPKKILKNNKILPLCYEKSLGEVFFKEFEIPFIYALRNGTVSGTAAALALALTSANVYFCGLDLAPNPSFQHARPNVFEIRDENFDRRLFTKETRLASSRFNSTSSLEIYADWFKSQNENFYKRIFRLSSNWKYSNNLFPLKDLDWKNIRFCKNHDKILFVEKKVVVSKNQLLKIAEKIILDKKNIGELFPKENLILARSEDEEERKKIEEEINLKKLDFIEKIKRRFL